MNRRKLLLDAAAIAAGTAVAGPAIPGDTEAAERLAWTLPHPASTDMNTVAHLRDAVVVFSR